MSPSGKELYGFLKDKCLNFETLSFSLTFDLPKLILHFNIVNFCILPHFMNRFVFIVDYLLLSLSKISKYQ